MKQYTPDELLSITATPAALGAHVGKEFMGREYKVYPWVLHMEQQILTMLYRPGPEIMVVSVPPQEGKSTYCSFLLPWWYLGRNPGNMIINISYNDQQAQKWGLRVRNAMQRYGQEFFGATIATDSDSKASWLMGNGFGGMMSAGIRSGITGNPGHLIILDDTLKNAEEGNSPIVKKRNLEEWDDSVTTRFQEDTKVLIVATRWAEDDLSGELLARSRVDGYEGFPVTELNLKAIAEPDPDVRKYMTPEELEAWRDPLGRKEGQGLKGQHSQKFFLIKKNSTPIGRWMALHQGTPTANVGGMFPENCWRYYYEIGEEHMDGDVQKPEVESLKRVRVWDIAASEGVGDWTVGTLLGKDAFGNVYILDVQRFRHAPGKVRDLIVHTAQADGQEIPILIEQERSGAGMSVVDAYKRDEELATFLVEGVRAEGDKESRATAASILQNKRKTFISRNAAWRHDWVSEHNQMDGKGGRPKHDDQIDTHAYGVRYIVGSGDTILWDASQMKAGPDATPDEEFEMWIIRQAVGAA